MPRGPRIVVPELAAFEWNDLNSARRAFDGIPAIPLRQAWLPKQETDFAPASVHVGWRDESLFVLAELTDADIFTGATQHNQRMWQLGDAFEIFLCPDGQQAYSEFHVAPNNLRLQFRFADAHIIRELGKVNAFEEAMIDEPLFDSAVWLKPEANHWMVSAKIPAASVCFPLRPMAGAKWYFSFSRYDYTQGREKPVISSTSPHTVPRFHEQSEWGVLQFK
jgi:hypothetical protein